MGQPAHVSGLGGHKPDVVGPGCYLDYGAGRGSGVTKSRNGVEWRGQRSDAKYFWADPTSGFPTTQPTTRHCARGVNLKLSFVGANPQPTAEPSAPVETNVSYFLGNDPAQWRPEVPVYDGVRYDELYPGIDLVLGGAQDNVLPWSLETRPGANSSQVRLRIEGADSATVNGRLLRIATPAGELALPLPAAGSRSRSKPWRGDGSVRSFAATPGAVDRRHTRRSPMRRPTIRPI